MNYITALPLRMLFIVSLVSREKFLDKISRHNLLLFSERLNSELGFMKEHFYFSNIKCSLFSSATLLKTYVGVHLDHIVGGLVGWD